ncbi:hypothetical protein NIES4103_30320 [Nostoc sp. NIES-4103]|nr:hypothetical protein NIES4103_30320 [Nostoc sp. NIES-4103]
MAERSPGDLKKLIQQVFEAGEAMDIDRFAQKFTEDAVYKFGNEPVVYGRQEIAKADSIAAFNTTVNSIKHHIENMWELGNMLIVEMDVTYVRKDGEIFNLPACDTVWFDGNLVQRMNIYMDITPVLN